MRGTSLCIAEATFEEYGEPRCKAPTSLRRYGAGWT
jgi:hypothetical protein